MHPFEALYAKLNKPISCKYVIISNFLLREIGMLEPQLSFNTFNSFGCICTIFEQFTKYDLCGLMKANFDKSLSQSPIVQAILIFSLECDSKNTSLSTPCDRRCVILLIGINSCLPFPKGNGIRKLGCRDRIRFFNSNLSLSRLLSWL